MERGCSHGGGQEAEGAMPVLNDRFPFALSSGSPAHMVTPIFRVSLPHSLSPLGTSSETPRNVLHSIQDASEDQSSQ